MGGAAIPITVYEANPKLPAEDAVGQYPFAFCVGYLQLYRVLNFTAPTAFDGLTVTQVSYQTGVTKLFPPWNTPLELVNWDKTHRQFFDAYFKDIMFAMAQKRTVVLELTNDGWAPAQPNGY